MARADHREGQQVTSSPNSMSQEQKDGAKKFEPEPNFVHASSLNLSSDDLTASNWDLMIPKVMVNLSV